MSQHPENPQGTHDKSLQTRKEAQGLEIEQGSKIVEKSFSSSHPVMPNNLKEDPVAQNPSTSEGAQSSPSSSSASAAISSSKAAESFIHHEESNPIYSAAGTSTENTSVNSLSMEVDSLVRFMLGKYQMKEIVRKEDILRLLVREDEDYYNDIFRQATDCMDMLFGIEIYELEHTNHYYKLFKKIGFTYDGTENQSLPKTGLLMIVLGAIYMKGNRATEEEILEMVNKMGIYPRMNNFISWDLSEIITKEFVRERYLKCQQVANTDPVQYEYVWGSRAHLETSKMKVLEFVAKIFGKDASDFNLWFDEALRDEQNRARVLLLNSPSSRATAS